MIKPKVEGILNIEVPAGVIQVTYLKKDEKVSWVEIINVDSFLAGHNLSVISDTLGKINFDVSYGGNFYAIIVVYGVKNINVSNMSYFFLFI